MPLSRPTAISRPVILGSGSGSGGDYLIERRILTNGDTAAVVAPPKTKRAILRGIGGGGGGAGICGPVNTPGGGGGAFAKTTLKVSAGDVLNATAGASGRGGTGVNSSTVASQSGQNGTASQVSINGIIVLYADFGRGAVYNGGNVYAGGGLGGSSTVCIGDVAASGGLGGFTSPGSPGVNGGLGGQNKPPYSGSSGSGGGGGAGGEKVVGNLFDLLPSGNGGFGGVGDQFGPAGGGFGNTFGGGGGGGTYAGTGSAQIGHGGDGGMGGLVIEFYSDTYIAPKLLTGDITRLAFTLSRPNGIAASGITGDGNVKSLTNQTYSNVLGMGFTANSSPNTAYSPDGKWLVQTTFSNQAEGTTPLLRIFKNTTDANFVYHSTATFPSPYTDSNLTVSGAGVSCQQMVVFSKDSTEFSIVVNVNSSRLFYNLINDVWTQTGVKNGFTGGASNPTNTNSYVYAESDNGLLKAEIVNLTSNGNWILIGLNRNSPISSSLSMTKANSTSNSVRLSVNPSGIYVVLHWGKIYANDGADIALSSVTEFSTTGGNALGSALIQYNSNFNLRGPIVWISDTRYVIFGIFGPGPGNNNQSATYAYTYDIPSGRASYALINPPSDLGLGIVFFSEGVKIDNTILLVSSDLTFVTLNILPSGGVTVANVQKNAPPVANAYATFFKRPIT